MFFSFAVLLFWHANRLCSELSRMAVVAISYKRTIWLVLILAFLFRVSILLLAWHTNLLSVTLSSLFFSSVRAGLRQREELSGPTTAENEMMVKHNFKLIGLSSFKFVERTKKMFNLLVPWNCVNLERLKWQKWIGVSIRKDLQKSRNEYILPSLNWFQ